MNLYLEVEIHLLKNDKIIYNVINNNFIVSKKNNKMFEIKYSNYIPRKKKDIVMKNIVTKINNMIFKEYVPFRIRFLYENMIRIYYFNFSFNKIMNFKKNY